MKETARCYAVITGDLVGSSKKNLDRSSLPEAMKKSFQIARELVGNAIQADFDIYRGDSFQGVLSKPELSLVAALAIRIGLHLGYPVPKRRFSLDARIAVGIGTIDFLPQRGAEGDGEAYRRSGPILDKMKGDARLQVRSPWPEADAELEVECALFDALFSRWSRAQAEGALLQMRGLTQEQIAARLNVSQPAIQERLRTAGYWAVQSLLQRFQDLIQENIGPGSYNERS